MIKASLRLSSQPVCATLNSGTVAVYQQRTNGCGRVWAIEYACKRDEGAAHVAIQSQRSPQLIWGSAKQAICINSVIHLLLLCLHTAFYSCCSFGKQASCMPSHVGMHGVHRPTVTGRTRFSHSSRCCSSSFANRYHIRQQASLIVRHASKQTLHNIQCFSATRTLRLRRSSNFGLMKSICAASVAEPQILQDSDLSEFVKLAEELAELAGSITQKYFRFGQLDGMNCVCCKHKCSPANS